MSHSMFPFIVLQYILENDLFIKYLTIDGLCLAAGVVYVAETNTARCLPTSIGQFILPLYCTDSEEPSSPRRMFSVTTGDCRWATTPDFETGMSVASPMAKASSCPFTLIVPLSEGIHPSSSPIAEFRITSVPRWGGTAIRRS